MKRFASILILFAFIFLAFGSTDEDSSTSSSSSRSCNAICDENSDKMNRFQQLAYDNVFYPCAQKAISLGVTMDDLGCRQKNRQFCIRACQLSK